jgi:hypothetical protein
MYSGFLQEAVQVPAAGHTMHPAFVHVRPWTRQRHREGAERVQARFCASEIAFPYLQMRVSASARMRAPKFG